MATYTGTNGDDTLTGSSSDDTLNGKNGDDTISGGDGDDTLLGGGGDDELTGGSGDDFINGGTGTDTAIFSGSVTQYTWHRKGENLYITGLDGVDRLIHVEFLRFDDATVEVDANNAPVAFDDSVALTEDDGGYSSGSASVLDNDFDWEGDSLSVTPGVFVGTYGTLTMNADGTYTYTLNPSAQSLAQGTVAQDSFNYTVSDGSASDTGTLTFNISGLNDAPVANADAASTGENAVVAIDVLANDTDIDNGAMLTVTAASAPPGQGTASVVGNQVQFDPGSDFDHLAVGESVDVVVSYTITDEFGATASSTATVTVTGTNDGPVANPDAASGHENEVLLVDVLANDTDVDNGAVLTVTAASAPAGQGTASVVGNQVQFDPGSDFDHLAVGESVIVSVSYTIEDEHGASASSTIDVTVTGANDAPVIDAGGTTATGTVTELPNNDPDENAFTHQASGTIDFADPDTSDVHAATATPQGGGYVGTFTLGPVDQGGDSVGWTFTVDDSDIDFLDAGESLVQTYTIEIDDGNGGTTTQDVTVTIHGADDNLPPDAVDDAYSANTNVTLTVPAGTGLLANDSDDAGVGTGPGETPVTAYDAVSANGGSVTVNPDGSFSYTSAPGFSGVDSFTYTITDAEGETDTATVTVTVGGDSVWFIDNAAVGSANLGTQADPYTSLAAFNAAQGTPNGPQPGDTVYLREGLGTYAEADGINLSDGQTLIGGGQDLVVDGDIVESAGGRPTIVTTGGANHGVELAQNNTVYGLDVGDTTGAGISDGNGSVGTLTLYDVGVSGIGQIVDIDQGGTLNVTLNGASSSASTGGAIDLAGVAGSFTVSGAVTIAGAHTGGGIDITGSSVTATFSGGGSVATGTATGINYVGNSGSLVIGGGNFDVTTTGGTAINAANGGTVTITGAGNNVASGTGTAVHLSNVTSGGITLESVSSAGGNASGIILDNAGSGGFTVTGLGSVAGSGGTISGKTGADGLTGVGVGVVILGTDNVSLGNMIVTGNANYGIFGDDVSGFTLRDSSVTANGDSLAEASIAFEELTGIALFEGNEISGGSGDNLRILNSGGALDLTVQDSADHAAVFGANALFGGDSLRVETSGGASLTMVVDGAEFQGARDQLVDVIALGSGAHHIELTGNTFHNAHANTAPGGGGVALRGGSGGTLDLDYIVEGNSFRGADGTALVGSFDPSSGTIRGHVAGNVIGIGDGISGVEGSSGGGVGIELELFKQAGAGTATHSVTIVDNEVYDIAFGLAGIILRSSGGGAGNGAVMEATLEGNTVSELGDFSFSALYALVGGSAFSGDYAQLGLDMHDNVFDNGDADFGANAVIFDQLSSDAHYYFPGYAGSPDGEFLGGTASADLGAFLAGQGNVMTDGVFATFPGNGVDAGIIMGATGDPLTETPWYP